MNTKVYLRKKKLSKVPCNDSSTVLPKLRLHSLLVMVVE